MPPIGDHTTCGCCPTGHRTDCTEESNVDELILDVPYPIPGPVMPCCGHTTTDHGTCYCSALAAQRT